MSTASTLFTRFSDSPGKTRPRGFQQNERRFVFVAAMSSSPVAGGVRFQDSGGGHRTPETGDTGATEGRETLLRPPDVAVRNLGLVTFMRERAGHLFRSEEHTS